MSEERMKIPDDWSFDSKEVAGKFDKHVREQLPWYDMISDTVGLIARHFVESSGLVYDIGCSTGNISRVIAAQMPNRKTCFIGIDPCISMKEQYDGVGEFVLGNAADYDFKPFDLAVCFLVLQFMNMQDRDKLLHKLLLNVKRSGAIIIVDKFLDRVSSPYADNVLRRITLFNKLKNNTSPEEIVKKDLSIAGVQRPVNHSIFSGIRATSFFKLGEFEGWFIEGESIDEGKI